jgi:hypothetical protein
VIVFSSIVWAIAILVMLAGLAAAIVASLTRKPILALLAAIPVGLGLLRLCFGLVVPPPDHAVPVIAALTAAALAIVAGNPITATVLNYADSRGGAKPSISGQHGGIIIESLADGAGVQREVLRGGTTIGYLERLVVVGAVAVGHWEIVGALIAIKGLGRFSELDTPETRERFIIGTLVSLVWAGVCAALFAF